MNNMNSKIAPHYNCIAADAYRVGPTWVETSEEEKSA
jgi:hypothetical protein